MKKIILSLMAFLCCGTIHANNHPAAGEFGVTAEYLFFKPSFDDTYFVINNGASATPAPGSVPTLKGKRLNNDLQFSSGGRLNLIYAFCDCQRALEVSFTHLNNNRTNFVRGNFLTPTVGPANFLTTVSSGPAFALENYPGTASSRLNARYNRADLVLSQGVFDCCDADVFLLFGLEAANLHLDEHYSFVNTSKGFIGFNNQFSHVMGVGPELGFEYDYAFWHGEPCFPGVLSLIVKSTGSLLASQARNGIKCQSRDPINKTIIYANYNDDKSWRVVPVFHARFGVAYERCNRWCRGSLEIGYEFNSYFRGFARSNLVDDVSTIIVTEYNNFDVSGLYVSASVNF